MDQSGALQRVGGVDDVGLGPATPTGACVDGADIVAEGLRLMAPEPLLKTEWVKPAALVVSYGTMGESFFRVSMRRSIILGIRQADISSTSRSGARQSARVVRPA
jgi:ornithine cyclodeaminase/alanine dehydrogenase-like protein (mu-crystallin family)